MKNYFITPADVAKLGDEAKSYISTNSAYLRFAIGDQVGWVFESHHLANLLERFGIKKVGTEKATNYDGVYWITLAKKNAPEVPSEPEVKILSWNSQAGPAFAARLKAITEEVLLPALKGQGVELSVPHGEPKLLQKKDDFQILVWSSPSSAKLGNGTPAKIWGIPVDCKDEPFSFSGNGININDPETDYSVAELIGRNSLYIHHDVVHNGTGREEEIFRKILQRVVDELSLSPKERLKREKQQAEELARKEKQQAEELARKNRNHYVTECKKRFAVTLDGLKQTVTNAGRRITEWQTKLVQAIRDHRDASVEANIWSKEEDQLNLCRTDFEKISALVEELAPSIEIHGKDPYLVDCLNNIRNKSRDRQSVLNEKEARVKECHQNLLAAIREVREAEARLAIMSTDDNKEVERYGLEYDRLVAMPKVKSVTVPQEGMVSVFTDMLYCTDPRTNIVHEIGAFEIKIPTNGKGDVRWMNLTRKVHGMNGGIQMAPHVFAEGNACYGNTKEIFPELIANYEFSVVAMLAIQFVETVNAKDVAGQHIDKWPQAPPELQKAKLRS